MNEEVVVAAIDSLSSSSRIVYAMPRKVARWWPGKRAILCEVNMLPCMHHSDAVWSVVITLNFGSHHTPTPLTLGLRMCAASSLSDWAPDGKKRARGWCKCGRLSYAGCLCLSSILFTSHDSFSRLLVCHAFGEVGRPQLGRKWYHPLLPSPPP